MNRQYRLLPELRRCCWYAIIGALLCVVASLVVLQITNRPVTLEWYVANGVILGGLVAAMACALRWRVTVDSHGLSRRIFGWYWDRWSWDDLASGRVRKVGAYVLSDPDRPVWCRFNFGPVGMPAAGELMEIINRYYRLPPPPELPETLTISYGLRKLRLNATGLQVLARKQIDEFLWSEVELACVERIDPLRRDFHTLLLVLPGHEIELESKRGGRGQTSAWHGANAEVLCEFITRHVPPERLDIVMAGDAATNFALVSRRLERARWDQRSSAWIGTILGVVLAALIGWEGIRGHIGFAVFGGILGGLYVGILMMNHRALRARVERLAEQVESSRNRETPTLRSAAD